MAASFAAAASRVSFGAPPRAADPSALTSAARRYELVGERVSLGEGVVLEHGVAAAAVDVSTEVGEAGREEGGEHAASAARARDVGAAHCHAPPRLLGLKHAAERPVRRRELSASRRWRDGGEEEGVEAQHRAVGRPRRLPPLAGGGGGFLSLPPSRRLRVDGVGGRLRRLAVEQP